MHLRTALQKYGDLALAAVLALSMTLELLAWADDELLAAIGAGLWRPCPSRSGARPRSSPSCW